MRVANVLRNSMYSMMLYVVLAVLGILIRQAFTRNLPIELLGLEGLFTNVISLLSIAEMGISTVISYGLYREIANRNEAEVNMLMSIYRYIYLIIGMLVALIGVVLFFFLPWIVRDDSIAWSYVQLVYVIQICTVLSTYFLAYRRTLFTADQKDYICVRIDLVCTFAANLVKLAAIVVWQSYTMYALSALGFNILANLIISHRLGKEYPFLHTVKVTVQDLRQRKFFVDVKNFLIHKLSYAVYFGTDAIVISSILGLRTAGLVANYVLLCDGVYKLLYKMLQGIIPSVANLVYTDDREKSYRVYRMLDFAYFLMGGYVACIYFTVLQPFVALFFGTDFLLDDAYVMALAFNVFLGMQFENAYNFRSTHGVFENDRGYMVLSAVTNLILSVILAHYLGVVGVMMGTIAGLAFIVYGRVQFVFRVIFRRSMKAYWWKHAWWSIVVLLEILLIDQILSDAFFSSTYMGLLIKCLCAAGLMLGMQILVFHRREEFRSICVYLGEVRAVLMSKIRGRKSQ